MEVPATTDQQHWIADPDQQASHEESEDECQDEEEEEEEEEQEGDVEVEYLSEEDEELASDARRIGLDAS